MRIVGALLGAGVILLVLIDAFEAILQPRRVTHRFRYARLYYRNTWAVWSAVALRIRTGKRREGFLGIFGPLSLLGIFTTWVAGLIVGFALFHWALRLPFSNTSEPPSFGNCLYLSGSTFFTLGYGDVSPGLPLGRALAVVEAGLGFAFLAVIISYLPVLYQAFSRREATISLMDARAGSPPSAGELLLRLGRARNVAAVDSFLAQWEQWAAELLESHLSFPVLSYYRSQHDNQSWCTVLATILDTCTLLLVEVKGASSYQAQLTFAMARHAAVDLALVLRTPPAPPRPDRLPPDRWPRIRQMLLEAGLELHEGPDAVMKLAELRALYEPFLNALAQRFLFALPPIMPEQSTADNWQRSAWMPRSPGIGSLAAPADGNEHFS